LVRTLPQDLAVKTPWGLITAQYDIFTNAAGRRLLSATADTTTGPSCNKRAGAAAAGAAITRGDPLLQAARKLLQAAPVPESVTAATPAGLPPGVPADGAAAPGLALPPNSTIPPDYDADLTKLGE